MTPAEVLTILTLFATVNIAAFGATWIELRSVRKRLHYIEGGHKLAEEILSKYRLMRREDRDPVIDDALSRIRRT